MADYSCRSINRKKAETVARHLLSRVQNNKSADHQKTSSNSCGTGSSHRPDSGCAVASGGGLDSTWEESSG